MARAHGHSASPETESTQEYGRRVGAELTQLLTDAQNGLRVLAEQAEERQPVTRQIAGEMAGSADALGSAVHEAEGLSYLFRSGNARDVERDEQPRRGESNANVGKAVRDA
jgi:hypothetical protein